MTWNPEEFHGIKRVNLPTSAILLPDIILLNRLCKDEFTLSNTKSEIFPSSLPLLNMNNTFRMKPSESNFVFGSLSCGVKAP